MGTSDAPTTRPQRVATVALIALGALAWPARLAAVGFISSRTDLIIGESTQELVFMYVLLLPAFLSLGVVDGPTSSALEGRNAPQPCLVWTRIGCESFERDGRAGLGVYGKVSRSADGAATA